MHIRKTKKKNIVPIQLKCIQGMQAISSFHLNFVPNSSLTKRYHSEYDK